MNSSTIVNSWTEWGPLELICVGNAHGICYPDETPTFPSVTGPSSLRPYLHSISGIRPHHRIQQAQAQLDHLADLLRAESVIVANSIDDIHDEDIGELLPRKQTSIANTSHLTDDRILHKENIDVCRPLSSSNEQLRFDHQLSTPHFTSKYQFGVTCPRDLLITLGDTVVEAPTPVHYRYFETEYYKPLLYSLWSKDLGMKWLQPSKPTCSPKIMFRDVDYGKKNDHNHSSNSTHSNNNYETNLNEKEIAFEAADIMRMGKDFFYKKSETANNQGLYWLRRTFPHLRFHMVHFPNSLDCHLDNLLVPLRPPTSGSPGLLLINQNRPPLASEMKLFTDNDWCLVWGSLPVTDSLSPVAMCSSNLNLNLLSLDDHTVVIEECEVPLYRLLHDDLGFDVITCPLRILNEFGGGFHCVTWDIRRRDSCVDYFPNQDYETECKLDLENYSDKTTLTPPIDKKV